MKLSRINLKTFNAGKLKTLVPAFKVKWVLPFDAFEKLYNFCVKYFTLKCPVFEIFSRSDTS